MIADDIIRAIAMAIAEGYSGADILDEGSPIRDAITGYLAGPQQPEEPQP